MLGGDFQDRDGCLKPGLHLWKSEQNGFHDNFLIFQLNPIWCDPHWNRLFETIPISVAS